MQTGKADICFVVPAFASVKHAPLGTATMLAACRARGLSIKPVFAHMMFAARIGVELYDRIADTLPKRQPGELVFRDHAYPPEVLATLPAVSSRPKTLAYVEAAAPEVKAHLDEVVEAIVQVNPRIVGITNMFQQNMASFAIARRVRAALPDVLIVMGGANVAGVMAKGLAQVFDCVDYFFDGEADTVFPDFCEAYLTLGERPEGRIVPCPAVTTMEVVPTPDFSDYKAAVGEYHAAGLLPPPKYVTYESSRGCWWGAKHHCTFCGLNQNGMSFRDKSPERVLRELTELSEEWPDTVIRTADNIMPTHFFADVLPQLAERRFPARMFYEVKSNLKAEQIALMMRAGVYSIQPGIESLSTPVLKLMRKGVSAHQNVSLLRMCAAYGMKVGWNLLFGFPGETVQNYRETIALLRDIPHLQPPDGFVQIMIDRFSPNFDDHAAMGIAVLKPFDVYRGLYPKDAPLDDIAFHFYGEYTTALLDDTVLLEELTAAVERWRKLWQNRKERPKLSAHAWPSGNTLVRDTRPDAVEKLTVLPPGAGNALAYLEKPHTRENLPAEVEAHIGLLLARRFVVVHEGLLMSVVVREVPASGKAQRTTPESRMAAAM